jgi:hypothetical protein
MSVSHSKAAFLAKYGTDEHKDKLISHPDDEVRRNLALRGNESHIDRLLNDKNEWVREAIPANPNVTDGHLKKLMDDKSTHVRQGALYRDMKRKGQI